jgi:methylthioribose-1-phosphate isomerase
VAHLPVTPFEWRGDALVVLDQTALPGDERYRTARTPREVAEAIRGMAVRGAPLLGVCAAYGMALAAGRSRRTGAEPADVVADLRRAGRILVRARPTAVNVRWAVRRVEVAAGLAAGGTADDVRVAAAEEAVRIDRENAAACREVGRFGAELIPDQANVLTHCNTGALATGGIGTALAAIVVAHESGKRVHVWVDETRPLLQGSRLTSWELGRLGIPMTLVADSAAASLMAAGSVDMVVVGADRIAANGDTANKVGTYALALAARHHDLPFYVAAPVSTIDLDTSTGRDIAIEYRDPTEVTEAFGAVTAPPGTWAVNPAFDVTPAELISAFVTDRGVVRQPYLPGLEALVAIETGPEPRA